MAFCFGSSTFPAGLVYFLSPRRVARSASFSTPATSTVSFVPHHILLSPLLPPSLVSRPTPSETFGLLSPTYRIVYIALACLLDWMNMSLSLASLVTTSTISLANIVYLWAPNFTPLTNFLSIVTIHTGNEVCS